MNLATLPASIREAVHFTCMTHVCNAVLEHVIGPNVRSDQFCFSFSFFSGVFVLLSRAAGRPAGRPSVVGGVAPASEIVFDWFD